MTEQQTKDLMRYWLRENIAEVCALLIVIDGMAIITYSVVFGLPEQSSSFVKLFEYIIPFTLGWLFKKKTTE